MRIIAAMSGGVDSSVAALLLKEQGHDVIGITIKTWPKEECGAEGEKLCCSLEAIQLARSVAEEINIPFYVVDLSSEFDKEVKKYFEEEYARGRTPNPCVYCNSKIKFGSLFRKAEELGAGKIATGHYAKIIFKDGCHFLAEGKDKNRDQSYFLYDIAKEKLPFVEFPLGDLEKEEVREIAAKNNFLTADRKSSQDICFATAEGDYRGYLEKRGIKAFIPGDILDASGKVIAKHKGIASYTVGQRKGLGVSAAEPVYVLKIDPERNTITVGKREQAMNSAIRVAGFNWLVPENEKETLECYARIRYCGEKVKATVGPRAAGEAVVRFSEPQFAPTPGQAAVFYRGEIVIGGGWIGEVL